MQPPPPLPVSTTRLLAHYDASEVESPEYKDFLIGRLFEEGDTRDLLWLTESTIEKELSIWLRTHGGSQLSRRSLAFWATVLGDVDAIAERPPEIEDLWPL